MEKEKTDNEKLISIVIISWNGEKFLPACIESVLKQNYQPVEIIIVDNASDDSSLSKIPKGIKIIKNEINKGFAFAANQSIKESRGEFVFILNQDVTLKKDFAENVYKTFKSNKAIGMVSGKILRMDGKTIDSTGQFMNKWAKPIERGYNEKDNGQFGKETEIFSVCGAVACYRRKMLEDIKIEDEPRLSLLQNLSSGQEGRGEYFDEDYFAFYEDLDLGWRAQLKGWNGWYNPKAIAYHYRGGTRDREGWFQILGRPKDLQSRIIFNRYLMIIKNMTVKHFLLYSPYFLLRAIIDLFFILVYIPKCCCFLDVIKLAKNAYKKRSFVQPGRLVSDKKIRDFII